MPLPLHTRFSTLLVGLSVAAAVGVSGCSTRADLSTMLDQGRGSVPISSEMLLLMQKKKMTASEPVLVRIFKLESELEVWNVTCRATLPF
jgi:murein L,D-transpeptidase YafK